MHASSRVVMCTKNISVAMLAGLAFTQSSFPLFPFMSNWIRNVKVKTDFLHFKRSVDVYWRTTQHPKLTSPISSPAGREKQLWCHSKYRLPQCQFILFHPQDAHHISSPIYRRFKWKHLVYNFKLYLLSLAHSKAGTPNLLTQYHWMGNIFLRFIF